MVYLLAVLIVIWELSFLVRKRLAFYGDTRNLIVFDLFWFATLFPKNGSGNEFHYIRLLQFNKPGYIWSIHILAYK